MNIIKVKSYAELSRIAADVIEEVIQKKPNAVLGLATGSSPIGTYEELVKDYKKGLVDFSAVRSVNLDEYVGLAPEHPQSYRYFMNAHLFDQVNINKENTYVPDGLTESPENYGVAYDKNIEDLGGVDLQLLGVGFDGHIGFNEPSDRFVVATHVEALDPSTIKANARFFSSESEVPTHAITMGIGSIMKAKQVLLIASGEEKAKVLERAFLEDVTPTLPASILRFHPNVTVIISEGN